VFPSNGSLTRRPASLRRVSAGRIPRLPRYCQDAATPGHPSRLASSSFARRYHAAACGSLPRATRRQTPAGQAIRGGSPSAALSSWRRPGLPRSWGTPCTYALLYDPGRTDASGHTIRRCSPRYVHGEGSCVAAFEAQSHGFGTRCLRFAGWIAPPPRKTRFRLPASSTGRVVYPQGSFQRFQSCLLHLFLLCQASWRKDITHLSLTLPVPLISDVPFSALNQ
jgi:hypothetical protein